MGNLHFFKTEKPQDESGRKIIYPVVLIGKTMKRNSTHTLVILQQYRWYTVFLGKAFTGLNVDVMYILKGLKKIKPCDANYLQEHLASYGALVVYIGILKTMLFHVQNILRMTEYQGISQRLNEIIGRIAVQLESTIGKTGHLGTYLKTTVKNKVPNFKIVEEYGPQFQSIMTELNDCGEELIRMRPEFGGGIDFTEVFYSVWNSESVAVALVVPVAFTFFFQLGAICNIASGIGDVIHVAHAANKLWDAFIDRKIYEAYLQNLSSFVLSNFRSNIASLKRVKETYVDKADMDGIKEETQYWQLESHPVPLNKEMRDMLHLVNIKKNAHVPQWESPRRPAN